MSAIDGHLVLEEARMKVCNAGAFHGALCWVEGLM